MEFAKVKLEEYSVLGLRTLLVGMAILSEEEYFIIKKKFEELGKSYGREENRKKIQDEIENHLFLIGQTVVEDKL